MYCLDYIRKSNSSEAIRAIRARCEEVARLAAPKRKRRARRETGRAVYLPRREALRRAIQAGGELEDLYAGDRGWTDHGWMDEWSEAKKAREEKRGDRVEGSPPTAWKPPWRSDGHRLHTGLTRLQSTIATQMRTGHCGLKQYLYKRRIKDVDSPYCECGEGRQDVKHVLLTCTRWQTERLELIKKAGTTNLDTMLSTGQGIKAAANWVIDNGILGDQFKIVRGTGIGNEGRRELRA